MSDTHRVLGREAKMNAVVAIAPLVIQDATPVLSAAIDTRLYPGQTMLVVALYKEVGATTHTMIFTATESATSGGSWSALGLVTALVVVGAALALLAGTVVPWSGTRMSPFLAASMPFLMADGTSFALPTPKPTTPWPSPTTTSALKLRFLPPFTTFVTRLMETTVSLMSS